MHATQLLAFAILILTIAAILRRFDVRLTLLVSGFVLSLIAKNPELGLQKMLEVMSNQNIISAVLPVLGYAALMEETGCNLHLLSLLTNPLRKIGIFAVPLVVLISFIFNISLVSASASVLAVGYITIPLLVGIGITPTVAASAVLIGAWGSVLSPGEQHASVIAQIANVPIIETIQNHLVPSIVSVICMSLILLLEAKKKNGSELSENENHFLIREPVQKVNYLKSILPVLPIPLLIVFKLSVFEIMISCTFFAMLICWKIGAKKLSNIFFDGIGKAYGTVFGIIIAAMVFMSCLDAAVDIKHVLEVFFNSQQWLLNTFAMFGTMLLAMILGSSDAVIQSFNLSITNHASELGLSTLNLGSLAWLGGQFGKLLSPIAPVVLVLANFANVKPKDLIKLAILPIMMGALICFLWI